MAGKTSTATSDLQDGQEVSSPVLNWLGERIAWHLPHLIGLGSMPVVICE
jgi:hypothetical protein